MRPLEMATEVADADPKPRRFSELRKPAPEPPPIFWKAVGLVSSAAGGGIFLGWYLFG